MATCSGCGKAHLPVVGDLKPAAARWVYILDRPSVGLVRSGEQPSAGAAVLGALYNSASRCGLLGWVSRMKMGRLFAGGG